MRLLLVRYGIASPGGDPVVRDSDRPLTRQGEQRLRLVASALPRIVACPRAILTSPLRRARQTAEILASEWKGLRPTIVPALASGEAAGIRHVLGKFSDDDTLILVGHENWLSQFTARLLGGKSGRAFPYRKGGVALIEVKPRADRRATLLWFIPPRVFRKL